MKYGLIGISNTLITFFAFYICTTLFSINDYVSNCIGYVLGFINSFIWNKEWVFKSHNKKIYKEFLLFVIGFLICYGIQIFAFWVLMTKTDLNSLECPFINIANFGEMVIFVIGMGIYTICNYAYNRFITFK